MVVSGSGVVVVVVVVSSLKNGKSNIPSGGWRKYEEFEGKL
jgi:hypothetical protein